MLTKTYIGCSGWSYPEWKGIFYPTETPQREYFSYYASVFNTVEINSTFYHIPSEKTVKSWYSRAPQGFKFSLKVNRFITHTKKFHHIKEQLLFFYGLADLLAEKMGCFLFQFPPSFIYAPEALDLLLQQLEKRHKNVVEFRHPSWWIPQVKQAFESEKITFCTVSGFPVPEEFILTTPTPYIRFHGNTRYSVAYSEEALLEWTKKIQEKLPQETWIYFNNTCKGYAIQNALFLKSVLIAAP